MDTTILPPYTAERAITMAVGIGIAIGIVMTQNLLTLAKDLGIGVYTGLSPSIEKFKFDDKQNEDIFNKKMEIKYKGSRITDVEKGIKHVRMIRYYKGKPVRLNLIEASTTVNPDLWVEPAIADKTLASRSKISDIAKRENAIVAINGGFFKPQTGIPLGTLMINKKVYTGPIYDRVAMGFFDNGYNMARIQLKATVNTNIGGYEIDNVNQPRMLSTHTIVYTRDWGKNSPSSPKYGSQLVVQDGKIIKQTDLSTTIPENGFVIVGPKKKLDPISKAKELELDLKINPEWVGVNHIISGGPYLVKNGDIYVDMTAQKLASIGGRNPRTAIGYTKDGHLILLTADGREGASIGLTLMELASLMKEFGCVNAMNLDGGGSTVMYVNGEVVNKPAVQGGIPLSHTLTISKKDYT